MDFLSANSLPWLEGARQRMRTAFNAGRLPHSLLVLSAPGLGVWRAADPKVAELLHTLLEFMGDDLPAMQLAAELHAAHPGSAEPSPEFVDALARRIAKLERSEMHQLLAAHLVGAARLLVQAHGGHVFALYALILSQRLLERPFLPDRTELVVCQQAIKRAVEVTT